MLQRLGIFFILVLCACSSSRKTDKNTVDAAQQKKAASQQAASPYTSRSAPLDAALKNDPGYPSYQAVYNLYSSRKYDEAIQAAQEFKNKYPQSELISQVYNLEGLSHLLARRFNQAATLFKQAVRSNKNAAYKPYLLYNLASAQTEVGDFPSAQQTLALVTPESVNTEHQLKVKLLRGRIYEKQQQWDSALQELIQADQAYYNNQTSPVLDRASEQLLEQINDPAPLNKALATYPQSRIGDSILFRLATIQEEAGKLPEADQSLRNLLEKFPRSRWKDEALKKLQSNESRAALDPQKIGLLLPMTGKFASFGKQALNGILLGLDLFPKGKKSQLKVVIEDSGDSPEQLLQALHRLYFNHHVVAVIGPLGSKGIEEVTQKAESYGLPLISLSQYTGTHGNMIFYAGLTPRVQTYEIAKYAIDRLRIKNFAVVYPRDKFGETYSQEFWNAVEEMGGHVTAVESYRPGEVDFREPIDKLLGLFYTDARQRELDALAKEREENQITKRNRKTDKYFALSPIVDFEAVFIPDEPKTSGQILPTFAYRDVDKIQFLGTSAWNSAEFLQRSDQLADGAIFIDAFFAGSRQPRVRQFVDSFKAAFTDEPNGIEALSYDAANVLKSILKDGTSNLSRSEVASQLRDLSDFPGVTGRITARDGQWSRTLEVLTIRDGKIQNP